MASISSQGWWNSGWDMLPFFRCPVVEICYEKKRVFGRPPHLPSLAVTSRAGYPSARISQETACAEPFGRPVELWCIPTMEMGYDKITSLSGIETMGNMFFSQPVCFFFLCHIFSKKAICGSSGYGSSTTGTMGRCGFSRPGKRLQFANWYRWPIHRNRCFTHEVYMVIFQFAFWMFTR